MATMDKRFCADGVFARMTLHVYLSPTMKFRMRLAALLVRLAARVIGCGFRAHKIEEK